METYKKEAPFAEGFHFGTQTQIAERMHCLFCRMVNSTLTMSPKTRISAGNLEYLSTSKTLTDSISASMVLTRHSVAV
jgi:hypothetical protein